MFSVIFPILWVWHFMRLKSHVWLPWISVLKCCHFVASLNSHVSPQLVGPDSNRYIRQGKTRTWLRWLDFCPIFDLSINWMFKNIHKWKDLDRKKHRHRVWIKKFEIISLTDDWDQANFCGKKAKENLENKKNLIWKTKCYVNLNSFINFCPPHQNHPSTAVGVPAKI